MDKYTKAIEERVCSICADSSDTGRCTLNKKEICAVQFHLEKIVEIVQSIDSDDMNEYHLQLKDQICSKCQAEEKDGDCYLREDANCSLDRYFPLIVETIKKVDNGEL